MFRVWSVGIREIPFADIRTLRVFHRKEIIHRLSCFLPCRDFHEDILQPLPRIYVGGAACGKQGVDYGRAIGRSVVVDYGDYALVDLYVFACHHQLAQKLIKYIEAFHRFLVPVADRGGRQPQD